MNRNSQINLNFYFRNNLVYLIIPNIFLRKKETTEYLAFSAWVPPYSIENLKKVVRGNVPFSNISITIPAQSVACISLPATGPPIVLVPNVILHESLVHYEMTDSRLGMYRMKLAPFPFLPEEVEIISTTPPTPIQNPDSISDSNSQILAIISEISDEHLKEIKSTISRNHLNEE